MQQNETIPAEQIAAYLYYQATKCWVFPPTLPQDYHRAAEYVRGHNNGSAEVVAVLQKCRCVQNMLATITMDAPCPDDIRQAIFTDYREKYLTKDSTTRPAATQAMRLRRGQRV
jgi:hypothetical protein